LVLGKGPLEEEKTNKSGKGLLLGKNSPFNSIPILGQIFYALSLHPKRTCPSAALPELCLLGYYKYIK